MTNEMAHFSTDSQFAYCHPVQCTTMQTSRVVNPGQRAPAVKPVDGHRRVHLLRHMPLPSYSVITPVTRQ